MFSKQQDAGEDDHDDVSEDYCYYYINNNRNSANCAKYCINLSPFNPQDSCISWILFTGEKTQGTERLNTL